MIKKVASFFVVCFIGAGLTACTGFLVGSDEVKGAVGIGTGVDQLKQSPCACTEIEMIIPDYAKM